MNISNELHKEALQLVLKKTGARLAIVLLIDDEADVYCQHAINAQIVPDELDRRVLMLTGETITHHIMGIMCDVKPPTYE